MTIQQTPTELSDLMEAALDVLERAPCDCPEKMRHEEGRHLSRCFLFDLNIAVAAAPPPLSPPATGNVGAIDLLMQLAEDYADEAVNHGLYAPATYEARDRLRESLRAEFDRPQDVTGFTEATEYPTLADKTDNPNDVNTLLVPFVEMGRLLSRLQKVSVVTDQEVAAAARLIFVNPTPSYLAGVREALEGFAAALPPPGRGMVPMTEEKLREIWHEPGPALTFHDIHLKFARAIEAAHGIQEGL